jgi:hypothetical protein
VKESRLPISLTVELGIMKYVTICMYPGTVTGRTLEELEENIKDTVQLNIGNL